MKNESECYMTHYVVNQKEKIAKRTEKSIPELTMCLAIPMKIIETDGFSAKVEVEGTSTDANVSLIENPLIGDYVIIHAGFAIEKLDKTEARKRIELFDEIGLTGYALP